MSHDNNARRREPPGRAFVTENQVEEALNFLALSAEEVGAARGEMVRTEFMIGSIEALAAGMSEERSADAKKWEARASSQYQNAVKEHASATARFETLRARREASRMLCDAWQTMSANRRGGI
jgi:hypothetical protein